MPCRNCGEPERDHIWLNEKETFNCKGAAGELLDPYKLTDIACDVATKPRIGGGYLKLHKRHVDPPAPEDPCDVDFMEEISS